MAFTDDLRGLSRAEQIARVQAVAREHGDQLDDHEAGQALNLYATRAVGGLSGGYQHTITDRHGGLLALWHPGPDLVPARLVTTYDDNTGGAR